MKEITIEEMKHVNGGLIWLTLGKVALAFFGTSFVAGLLDGFVRPLGCN